MGGEGGIEHEGRPLMTTGVPVERKVPVARAGVTFRYFRRSWAQMQARVPGMP